MQADSEYHDEKFTADPGRVAVDEKQVQLADDEEVWLHTAIGVDSNVVLQTQPSTQHGTDQAAEFLVEGMGYLTVLAQTRRSDDFNDTYRTIVEKLFQTFTMRSG